MKPEEILDKHNQKWQPEHNARYVRWEAALAAMYEYARTEQKLNIHSVSGSSPSEDEMIKLFESITEEDLEKAVSKYKGLRSANGGEAQGVSVDFDKGYEQGYNDATSEAIEEIHKNYKPRA